MQASVDAAQATLKQAQWQLAQTEIRAPVSGWVTNLTTRIGDYADTGKPLFALVDSLSLIHIYNNGTRCPKCKLSAVGSKPQ